MQCNLQGNASCELLHVSTNRCLKLIWILFWELVVLYACLLDLQFLHSINKVSPELDGTLFTSQILNLKTIYRCLF